MPDDAAAGAVKKRVNQLGESQSTHKITGDRPWTSESAVLFATDGTEIYYRWWDNPSAQNDGRRRDV